MREESHLEDMRSAIRGDFARLAERRGDQELMQVEASVEAVPEDVPAIQDPVVAERVEESLPPRSWFARFVSP